MQSTYKRVTRGGIRKNTHVAATCSRQDQREASEIVELKSVVEQQTRETELLHARLLDLESALQQKLNANAKQRVINAREKNATARQIANLHEKIDNLASKLKKVKRAKKALHAKLIETKRRVGIRWGSIMKCVAWLTFLGAGVRGTQHIMKAVASTNDQVRNANPLLSPTVRKLNNVLTQPPIPNGKIANQKLSNNYKATYGY
jgi:predicted RNase H-like nuclease (RuvC/YqgF family)